MKKNVPLTILSIVLFVFTTTAQNDNQWESVSTSNVAEVNKSVKRDNFPADYKLFQLKSDVLQQKLKKLTALGSVESTATIQIPNTLGEIERFVVYESSNFMPDLQAQYPDIRAFTGVGLDDKKAQIRLSFDPNGIQVMVFRSDKRNEFIESYSSSQNIYAVFNSSREKGKLPFTCTTEDKNLIKDVIIDKSVQNRANNGLYKTMRLAISCTAEYANYFGATTNAQSSLVLAGFNATLTRVNGVNEKDLALKLLLVAQTTNVIYYNPATDPYAAVAGGAPASWNV